MCPVFVTIASMDGDVITRNVAKILADRQIKLGLSLRQIEEKSGVTRMSASRILSGESAMPLDKFEAVARALDLVPWQVMREAEQSLEEQADEHSKPDGVINFPRAQEENLPDFTKLAARKVTTRPEWEKRQALDGIGEENQIDPYELD